MTDLSVQGLTSNQQSQPTVRPAPNVEVAANQRRQGLEQARRAATAQQVQSAEAASAQRAEQFRESAEIVQRAIGANTRLEISAGQGSNPFTLSLIHI